MRKPRQLQPDARYHVSARAQRQEMIMDSDAMKALFLEVVQRAKEKYPFRLENFCVMGNHFHFILQPQKGISLSRVMQWIMSVFAMSWNRIRGLTGHVWGERFYSRIIHDWTDFLRVSQYIDGNPVKVGLVPTVDSWPFGGPWFRSRHPGRLLDDPEEALWNGDRARR